MGKTIRNISESVRRRALRTLVSGKGGSGGDLVDRWAKKALLGADGTDASDAHQGRTNSPRGFDTWDEVGSGSKRWAKHSASRARRIQGHAQISEQMDFSEA